MDKHQQSCRGRAWPGKEMGVNRRGRVTWCPLVSIGAEGRSLQLVSSFLFPLAGCPVDVLNNVLDMSKKILD